MPDRDDKPTEQDDDLVAVWARLRRERDERIAKIEETDYDVEPSPHLQELLDTQDEFRERAMAHLRALL